jgi:hypothetical protein
MPNADGKGLRLDGRIMKQQVPKVATTRLHGALPYLATVVFVLILIFLPSATRAQSGCVLPEDMRTDQRPDPEGVPTPVKMGILVADITEVDDVAQSIEGDFIAKMQWQDPRLVDFAGCRFPTSAVWFPRVDLLNSNQLTRRRTLAANQVRVLQDGDIVHVQRSFGSIATYHDLSRFPFDNHEFRLRIAEFDYSSDELILIPDEEFTDLADLINIPDWTIHDVSIQSEDIYLKELDKSLSILTLAIDASRNSGFYILKVLVPLVLIVMMSWVVFWISPEKFGPQIGISATAMLTLIAFQFAFSSVLPKLSYFTTIDLLVFGSTILVFLSLCEATLTSVLATRGRDELAARIDLGCRWLFPIALLAWWVIVLI